MFRTLLPSMVATSSKMAKFKLLKIKQNKKTQVVTRLATSEDTWSKWTDPVSRHRTCPSPCSALGDRAEIERVCTVESCTTDITAFCHLMKQMEIPLSATPFPIFFLGTWNRRKKNPTPQNYKKKERIDKEHCCKNKKLWRIWSRCYAGSYYIL